MDELKEDSQRRDGSLLIDSHKAAGYWQVGDLLGDPGQAARQEALTAPGGEVEWITLDC